MSVEDLVNGFDEYRRDKAIIEMIQDRMIMGHYQEQLKLPEAKKQLAKSEQKIKNAIRLIVMKQGEA